MTFTATGAVSDWNGDVHIATRVNMPVLLLAMWTSPLQYAAYKKLGEHIFRYILLC